MSHLNTVAVDIETTYVKKTRDISSLGVVPYLEHPETEIYLMSVVADDLSGCAHPRSPRPTRARSLSCG